MKNRRRITLGGAEYYILEPGDTIRAGDVFQEPFSPHLIHLFTSSVGAPSTYGGYLDLRPVPQQRMVTITYEVTEEYAEAQARVTNGRNDNNNRRFEPCRRVVEASPQLKTIISIRKEIKAFAAQSIEAEKTVKSCDEMVGKLKADIRNLQDG